MRRSAPAIAVLISGTGTNLQALIDASATGAINARVAAVISDRRDAQGLQRAREAGIEARQIRVGPRQRPRYDAAILGALRHLQPDLIVLAGFMRILSPEFIETFSDRLINIHPSLLPKYPGLDTHRRALEAGDTEHGATVHFVTGELDAGPRIIQYRIAIRSDDTPQSLAERVLVGEHIILPRAVGWFVDGRLSVDGNRVMLDDEVLPHPIIVEGT